jgi:integrase
LRHSYAAMLIAQGAHPRAIMERMGHSTITVTLDTYGDLLPKIDAALDEALDEMYRTSEPRTGRVLRRTL